MRREAMRYLLLFRRDHGLDRSIRGYVNPHRVPQEQCLSIIKPFTGPCFSAAVAPGATIRADRSGVAGKSCQTGSGSTKLAVRTNWDWTFSGNSSTNSYFRPVNDIECARDKYHCMRYSARHKSVRTKILCRYFVNEVASLAVARSVQHRGKFVLVASLASSLVC